MVLVYSFPHALPPHTTKHVSRAISPPTTDRQIGMRGMQQKRMRAIQSAEQKGNRTMTLQTLYTQFTAFFRHASVVLGLCKRASVSSPLPILHTHTLQRTPLPILHTHTLQRTPLPPPPHTHIHTHTHCSGHHSPILPTHPPTHTHTHTPTLQRTHLLQRTDCLQRTHHSAILHACCCRHRLPHAQYIIYIVSTVRVHSTGRRKPTLSCLHALGMQMFPKFEIHTSGSVYAEPHTFYF